MIRKRIKRGNEILVTLLVEIPEELQKQITELQIRGKSKREVVIELLRRGLSEIKKEEKE